MGKEEFAEILETIINDVDAASGVARGDFSSLDSGELTPAEQALLTAAAGELDDDVSGFGIDAFLKLGDIDGESGFMPKVEMSNKPRVRAAFTYLKLEIPRF